MRFLLPLLLLAVAGCTTTAGPFLKFVDYKENENILIVESCHVELNQWSLVLSEKLCSGPWQIGPKK